MNFRNEFAMIACRLAVPFIMTQTAQANTVKYQVVAQDGLVGGRQIEVDYDIFAPGNGTGSYSSFNTALKVNNNDGNGFVTVATSHSGNLSFADGQSGVQDFEFLSASGLSGSAGSGIALSGLIEDTSGNTINNLDLVAALNAFDPLIKSKGPYGHNQIVVSGGGVLNDSSYSAISQTSNLIVDPPPSTVPEPATIYELGGGFFALLVGSRALLLHQKKEHGPEPLPPGM